MDSLEAKERDLTALLGQIISAFAGVPPPAFCHDILTQADFEAAFMGDELNYTLRHLYNYSVEEVHYLTPFLMRGYLNQYGRDRSLDDDLGNYLFWFSGFKFDVDFVRNVYLSFYEQFDPAQRQCVCSFLRFLKTYKMDEGFIEDDVTSYWCTQKVGEENKRRTP
ncbi:MAG: hypothetical protein QUS14_13440 [Pyrinomonadaceae bacterium]|nr:hypothetical protein [Pyrinomonadaceae bacterium]